MRSLTTVWGVCGGNAAGFKDGVPEVAGLDFEYVETAVVVGVNHLPIE